MIDRNELKSNVTISSFDGLRAVAIISIIAHQIMGYRVPGGFLGINIFFILSGYWMTTTLMDALMHKGKVPLKPFLVVRMKKIFPPLLAMLLTVVSYLLVFQRELLFHLRNSLLTSFLFVNNWWQIFQEEQYRIPALTPSPFDHLSYLSLAVQYYLLWPILFVFFSLWTKKHVTLVRTILLLTVLSAIEMLLVYQGQASMLRVLFGTDTRAFSLLMGAVLALFVPVEYFNHPQPIKGAFERYGRLIPPLLLVSCLLMMKEQSPWMYRGGMLLFDGIVASVMVWSLHPQSVVSVPFRLKFLTMIGRRSFSYYLWYFPIDVLYQAKIGDSNAPSFWQSLVEVGIFLFISEAWYQLFECDQLPRLKRYLLMKLPSKQRFLAKVSGYGVVLLIMLLGFFQTTSQFSKTDSALQARMAKNIALAAETQKTDKKSLKTINHVEGLTREETVFSSNSLITFIGDTSLLAMAQEIPKIYPNAVISADPYLKVYEMNARIHHLLQQQKMGEIVVLMVGNTGMFSKQQLESVIKTIGMEKQYFFVTTVMNRTWQQSVNAVLEAVSEQYSNVHLLQWQKEVLEHQAWLYPDASFVTDEGANQQLLFIAKNIYQTLRGS